jgi:uncharacterized protein YycO
MRVLFVRTDHGLAGIGSRLIRAFEGGLASHCGTMLSDGSVVDTTWPHGAQRRTYAEFMAGRTLVTVLDVPLPDEAAAEAWLLAQVGQPYDLLDILSFMAWRDIGRRDRYVCSSQTLRAMLHGGLQLLERPDRWGVRHMLILADAMARRDGWAKN